MFRHTDYLQLDAKPEKPDPVYAHEIQEPIGGAYGEITAITPAPDPKLYATYDGSKGDPASAAFGTEKGVVGKIKDALDPDAT